MASWLLIVPRRPRLLPRQPRLLHGAGLAAGARAGGGRRTPRGARQAPGGAGAQGQGAPWPGELGQGGPRAECRGRDDDENSCHVWSDVACTCLC